MMNKKNNKIVILHTAILAGTLLTGCSATKEQFDFSKKAPDEFAVICRAPLEMPPDYGLRPPRPGAQRPQEQTTDNLAAQTLFGTETAVPTSVQMNAGESILLQKAGAQGASSDIRDIVDQETAILVDKNTSTVNKIIGKTGSRADVPATVVDPIKETARIKQNQAEKKPVTEGETPTIEE